MNECPCPEPNDLMGFCVVHQIMLPTTDIIRCRTDEKYRQELHDKYNKREEEYVDGPGTELAKIFKAMGIVAVSGCKCKDYAQYMNQMGADWCLDNVKIILNWLHAEAKRRKLPFSRTIVKMLIVHTINKYKRKIQKKGV